ncbi:MAG: hypothetical protein R3B06_18420 [Kofleriaceae bacterium]
MLLAAVATSTPRLANARSQISVTYPADGVFATAVRFVRIELDAKIVDKDPASGYLVFEYVDDGKPYRTALEVVPTSKDGAPRVNVIVDISDRPDYLETMLLERLRRKLRADLGDEPRPAAPAAPAPPADPAPPAAPTK